MPTGDKGNIVTISLIAFRKEDFILIEEKSPPHASPHILPNLLKAHVERYCLPQLGALNFVLHRPILIASPAPWPLDAHGKCLGSALLALEI